MVSLSEVIGAKITWYVLIFLSPLILLVIIKARQKKLFELIKRPVFLIFSIISILATIYYFYVMLTCESGWFGGECLWAVLIFYFFLIPSSIVLLIVLIKDLKKKE